MCSSGASSPASPATASSPAPTSRRRPPSDPRRTSMKALIVSLVLLIAASAGAQTVPADASLYRSFGEKPGLVKLMDDLMLRIEADPRMAAHFKDANKKRVKEQLVDQFCQL